ncbi:hypothetical protein MS7884_3879 [Enterobacter hormaechei]|nr:hypothetical protein MS7884_3879 [Enterobacter hormaechei]
MGRFFMPYRRPAERLHLMRVNLSTSSDCSYAVGGYFVGVLPWWFIVLLGVVILSLELNKNQAQGEVDS